MRVSRLLTTAAGTFACFTGAVAGVAAAGTGRLLGARHLLDAVLALGAIATSALSAFAFTFLNVAATLTLCLFGSGTLAALTALHVGQTTSLSVNVTDLLIALSVEGCKFLTGRGTEGLLEIRAQLHPAGLDSLGDTVVGIHILGLLGGVIFAIKILESIGETLGDTVLLVQSEGTLDGLVTDRVAVRQILCNDAGAWLILLLKIVA